MTVFFYLPIALTIVSNIFYHVFQRVTPTGANPFLALTITYLTAAAVCALLLGVERPGIPLVQALAKVNWISVALGVAIVGLELGFLLAYRAGWRISLAALVSNSLVSLSLIPIGLIFFREKLSPLNLIGIVVCVIGLAMINFRS